MATNKSYPKPEVEGEKLNEPFTAYNALSNQQPAKSLSSIEIELSRAITGDELINRLRPRVKALFE